ncbi:Chaperonin GroEL (HSP60 family) [Marininema mesophilum]|uniref:Chaperonin GroEL (HSP60 family) n=1 Tax=Marininema mesophilum TaxID=1048340 RepID=A0A1H2R8Y4_9BACL|nr:TCP-1/cpn60 chaperonin family protein [Marininema mesophilum]SDW15668.1 Chaperonin GroEL (HSP60 family) [Marininema mesophilum]
MEQSTFKSRTVAENPRTGALLENVEAVRSIAVAVEGTLGPKGLDTMLVGEMGEVIVTNDGVTILEKMEIHHPAARMISQIARAQQEEVGDGTTTATLLAATLVEEGTKQVGRGVPVAKVIAGIRRGIQHALEGMQKMAHPIWDLKDEWLQGIAFTAGREQEDVTDLVIEAALMVGREKLLEKNFRLSEAVTAHPRVESGVFSGLLVKGERLNLQVSDTKELPRILVIGGDLTPEPVETQSEAGFRKLEENREALLSAIGKLVESNVEVVLVEGEVDPLVEDRLSSADLLVVSQISREDINRVAEHIGARILMRTSLSKPIAELEAFFGMAELVECEERLGCIRVISGAGKSFATILVSASTEEVVRERERIAKDAAAAVQAAVRGGFLPGGGAAELALAREVEKHRDLVQGTEAFGVSAVAEALHRPMSQVVANAGFNPLEKVEEVKALQWKRQSKSLGVDCDRGVISDMVDMGVVDPLPVKYHALQAAGEVSTAILRIHTVVPMKGIDAR